MVQLAVLLFAVGVPETYQREIIRVRARRAGVPHKLAPAASGVTIASIVQVTVIHPFVMLFTEPVVAAITLYLGLNFAVVFQWFITVPVVLSSVYSYTPQQVGLAFTSAIIGSLLAALTSIIIEQFTTRVVFQSKRLSGRMIAIEHRLYPAMLGGFFIIASLFWIGNTAAPTFNSLVPITGTGVYVYGNLLVLISLIPYIFDAYPPRGTLSALTVMACFRLAAAGVIPLVIIQFFTNATGKWALSTFGFIQIPFVFLPFVLFFFGAKLRAKSRFSDKVMPREMMTLNNRARDSDSMGA
jgi:MFS transporter, DHA1 family, multidrug resistance protein